MRRFLPGRSKAGGKRSRRLSLRCRRGVGEGGPVCRAASGSQDDEEVRGEVVGILGGGQLGRMLGNAAISLGLRARILDGSEAPAAAAVGEHVQGSVQEREWVKEFAEGCDVVTVEVEHVNADALEEVEAKGTPVHPSPWTVRCVQDKLSQREFLSSRGVPVPRFRRVTSKDELSSSAKELGFPLLLKARFGAYDGRGNVVVNSEADLDTSADFLGGLEEGRLYVEEGVDFAAEVAVIVGKGSGKTNSNFATYSPVQTFHERSILRELHAPAPLEENALEECHRVARLVAENLGGRGVFGVELFVTKDGEALLNEVAPRVHNSGHHSIEACATSQFEQHLRAVLGWPLGDTSLLVGSAVMRNILGEADGPPGAENAARTLAASLEVPLVKSHWYGKGGVRQGRKIGHLTALSGSLSDCVNRMRLVEAKAAGDDALVVRYTSEVAMTEAALGHQERVSAGKVGIIMGSESDLPTMAPAAEVLEELGVEVEVTVVSAHRTPDRMAEYARAAPARGLNAIIAGAGGAAHLPGMVAAQTPLPVIGVPVPLKNLDGWDSLLSICQMPRGVPVATVAVGNSENAGLLAARIVGAFRPEVLHRVSERMERSKESVLAGAQSLERTGWRSHLHGQSSSSSS